MEANVGIDPANKDIVAKILGALVADEFVLYVKTLNFHWNLIGPRFNDLHALFGGYYDELQDIIDSLAEQMRKIGAMPPGSMEEFLSLTRLSESKGSREVTAEAAVSSLLADHETIIRQLQIVQSTVSLCGDSATNNMLVDLVEKHYKMAWFLRSLAS